VEQGRHSLRATDPVTAAPAHSPAPERGGRRLFNPLADERMRGFLIQAALLVAVLLLVTAIIHNVNSRLIAEHKSWGFAFLSSPAGFDVSMSLLPFDAEMSFGRVFVVGALNTLLVSLLGIVTATVLGTVIGVLRLSGNWLVMRLAAIYVEVIRNVPLLLQIIFWYTITLTLPLVRESLVIPGGIVINRRGFYLPRFEPESGAVFVVAAFGVAVLGSIALAWWARARQAKTGRRLPVALLSLAAIVGVPAAVNLMLGSPWTVDRPRLAVFDYEGGICIIAPLAALWFALSTYTAAFIAEIVRAGIQSVPNGQKEAAAALGLRPGVVLSRIVLPQALRVIVPPLTSQFLNLTKNSSLAMAIGYPDIAHVFLGTALTQTGRAIEITAITMAFYLTISLLISLFMNVYNRAIALKGSR
jgi:general L-amino acid transport system permease protein